MMLFVNVADVVVCACSSHINALSCIAMLFLYITGHICQHFAVLYNCSYVYRHDSICCCPSVYQHVPICCSFYMHLHVVTLCCSYYVHGHVVPLCCSSCVRDHVIIILCCSSYMHQHVPICCAFTCINIFLYVAFFMHHVGVHKGYFCI